MLPLNMNEEEDDRMRGPKQLTKFTYCSELGQLFELNILNLPVIIQSHHLRLYMKLCRLLKGFHLIPSSPDRT